MKGQPMRHPFLGHHYAECTYLGIKTDQTGDNTTEIKYRINQTRKAIKVLKSIWWHKNITKNRKLYIYQTIIQSILMYGAEVWQIPTAGWLFHATA